MTTFAVSLTEVNPGLGSTTLNPPGATLADAFSAIRGEPVTFLPFPPSLQSTTVGSGGGIAIF